MKLQKKQENQIIFNAEINESLANAIRRYINQIPTLAIESVEISKNDSPLYDETIAHRLGLIPLESSKISPKSKEIKLKLSSKKEGPVYSEELKGIIQPAHNKIPISDLKRGQELEFVATTQTGKGKEHSKFTPGLMFYRNIFDIKVDRNCPTEIVDICPLKVFSSENGKIKIQNSEKCDECGICLEYFKKQGKELININPTNELLITLESFGHLPCEDIFKKSIEILKKGLAEVGKKISKE
ncbi:MAG: DNA-directed RNA polymerase subunit D [Nanoarchaeota archaeon]|nr:DNA-directed RNA polymerase subunit D [Nanoarchaeota archaeon]MBU1028014.1 DNA-directed RNA polymerase subunit D [Nanoarchaeota archaeon]